MVGIFKNADLMQFLWSSNNNTYEMSLVIHQHLSTYENVFLFKHRDLRWEEEPK